MIKFGFDLTKLRASLLPQFSKLDKERLTVAANAALAELVAATPVDTGEAAESWSFSFEGNQRVVLQNNAAHIVFLNTGSSEQAPSYFIETIILKYGKPIGPIVTYK